MRVLAKSKERHISIMDLCFAHTTTRKTDLLNPWQCWQNEEFLVTEAVLASGDLLNRCYCPDNFWMWPSCLEPSSQAILVGAFSLTWGGLETSCGLAVGKRVDCSLKGMLSIALFQIKTKSNLALQYHYWLESKSTGHALGRFVFL